MNKKVKEIIILNLSAFIFYLLGYYYGYYHYDLLNEIVLLGFGLIFGTLIGLIIVYFGDKN